MEWISVKDRLPGRGENVLVCDKDRTITEAVYYEPDFSCSGPWEDWEAMDNVTHWMPFPEPPKDEE